MCDMSFAVLYGCSLNILATNIDFVMNARESLLDSQSINTEVKYQDGDEQAKSSTERYIWIF